MTRESNLFRITIPPSGGGNSGGGTPVVGCRPAASILRDSSSESVVSITMALDSLLSGEGIRRMEMEAAVLPSPSSD